MKFLLKKHIYFLLAFFLFAGCGETGRQLADTEDNDLFNNAESVALALEEIFVGGEVLGGGPVDLEALSLHSCLVKEMILNDTGVVFIGAFRYEGYSLHDIVAAFPLEKLNSKKFRPIVDAYIEVENALGEKVVFSWGEVFFPAQRHQILLASRVMPVIPKKTGELWPMPEYSKLVVAGDLYTERNIDRPVKITVRSYPLDIRVEKGMSPLYSPHITLQILDRQAEVVEAFSTELSLFSLPGVIYGSGRGLHSTLPLEGMYLKECLKQYVEPNPVALRQGLIVVASADGYRATFSCSEVLNRNDHSELLLKHLGDVENGAFRLFVPGDFFSDRGIKGVSLIQYSE